MIQTLWFFIKIIVLVGVSAWLVSIPGSMEVTLFDYKLTVQTGVFVLCALILLILLFLIYKIIRAVFSVPKILAKKQEDHRQQKGFSALTRGLVAVAAGDTKQASNYAKQARVLLPDQNGLQLLLEAQAATMRGEGGLAQNRFQELMQDKDAGFLGIRGLLKAAIDKGNIRLALTYAEQAAKIHKDKEWVQQTLYVLQIQNRLWSDALETGKKLVKINPTLKDKIETDTIAIYLMRYDYEVEKGDSSTAYNFLKKAKKLDAVFAPTVARMLDYHLSDNKISKAVKLFKQTWAEKPHSDLADYAFRLGPSPVQDQGKYLKWFKDIVALCPESVESQILAARATMDIELWGEAKAYLMVAEKIEPAARLYRLRAIVEQNSTHNEDSIRTLMEKASESMPDKVWICTQTGIIYDQWMPIAAPHGSFNTIKWAYPGVKIQANDGFNIPMMKNPLLIDPMK